MGNTPVMMDELIGSVRFDEQHLHELEQLFRLSDAQLSGLDVVKEDIADLLSTFHWAMYEGSAAICLATIPECVRLVEWVCQYCIERRFHYDVQLENDTYMLNLY